MTNEQIVAAEELSNLAVQTWGDLGAHVTESELEVFVNFLQSFGNVSAAAEMEETWRESELSS